MLAPVVVVFTKYDKLVCSKYLEEDSMGDDADEETLRERSKVNAAEYFAASVSSLDKWAAPLRIPTPAYINISGMHTPFRLDLALIYSSVSESYEESIAGLVDVTRKIVHERLQGDAWIIWAIAQRANLPAKIAACVEYVLLLTSRYNTSNAINSKGVNCMRRKCSL